MPGARESPLAAAPGEGVTKSAATAADVCAAIRLRFPSKGSEWGVLFEVGNATGHAARRRADAVAMNLWPSRDGLAVHGIEVKVARRDWQRELQRPDKAEPVAEHCNYWWIAAGGEDIVRVEELPSLWGLMVLRDGVLVVVKEAVRRDVPEVSREFLAAVFRASQRSAESREVQAVVAAAVQAARAKWAEDQSAIRGHGQQAQDARLLALDRFERETGLSVTHATDDAIASVRMAAALSPSRLRSRVGYVEKMLRAHADEFSALIQKVSSSEPSEADGSPGDQAT